MQSSAAQGVRLHLFRYLHIDAAVYEDPTVVGDLYLAPVRASYADGKDISPSHYRRLTIDLQAPSGGCILCMTMVQLAGRPR
jgi:hypothetical protein